MRILFTKGNSLLSKAIVGLTTEPVSHCALQFGSFIVHSNLLGVHLDWAPNFLNHAQVIFELERAASLANQAFEDVSRLDKILVVREHSFYDFGALFFIGLCLLARNYLQVPMPKSNLWQTTGMDLCTEWIQEFLDASSIDSMITPYKLYQRLKLNGGWKDYGSEGNQEVDESTN